VKVTLAQARMPVLLNAFDDSQVAVGGVAQDFEGGFVGVAFVGGDRGGDTSEFDYHDSLVQSVLKSFGGGATHEDFAAAGCDGRKRYFCVGRECGGIRD
jgi:hypothetical protein